MAKLRSIFGFILIIAVVFGLWRVLPPIYANFQFQEWLTEESRTASYKQMTNRELQVEVQAKAEQLGIALQPENLEVQKNFGNVNIKAEYEVSVDLLVYNLKLKFSPQARNSRI
ncbi:MAG TPA: hypothetical protein VMT82_09545 [candidate division Zixibacteria bacterium]|nr:hypothetical protein [candidate division Zixibacteria bacterium]